MEKVVLITNDKFNLPGVKISKTVANINLSDYDCLVFHSSVDTEVTTIQFLRDANKLGLKIIYINQKIIPLYYCVLTTFEADIYDSEDYLDDITSLDYIVSEYKNTGISMTTPNEEFIRLSTIITSLVSNPIETITQLSENDYWLKTLETSVANVETALAYSLETNEKAINMLDASLDLAENLQRSNEQTLGEMDKLKDLINEHSKRNTRTNSTFLFGTYQVPVHVPKVLYIKAYSNCKYLNTFILQYQKYLINAKQTPAVVLLAFPKLKDLMRKYSNVGSRLSSDTLGVIGNNHEGIYTTFEPKKDVMDKFFGLDAKLYIVVDLMFDEPIIDGAHIEKLYAVGSTNDVKDFKLPIERTFMSISSLKGSINITHIQKYSTNPVGSVRQSMYFKQCQESFSKLDNLFVERR